VKIVFDTNVLARAHQRAQGPARRALLQATTGEHTTIIFQYLLQGLGRILTYPRLLKRSALSARDIAEYVEYLARIATLVDPAPLPANIFRDQADEPVLGTALAGSAEVVCTLDSHFFDDKVIAFAATKSIRILTDVELLQAVRGGQ
jgi:putative PIN family toxin of toxin-antitoxin system